MKNRLRFGWLSRQAFVLSLLLGLGITQSAQAQQQLPTQANPGLLTPAPTDQIEPTRPAEIEKDQETPKVDIDTPSTPGVVGLEGNQFTVKTLTLEGNTVIKTEELKPLLSDYENKTLTLDELSKLVEKISTKYRERGYLTSVAYIPPQNITEGNIVIRVMEGKVGDIEIAGNKFFKTGIIARYVEPNSGDPFNVTTLERNLARINQYNDFRVRAVLSPGDETGETNLRLEVEERQPWQISTTWDNQGRPGIGTMRYGAELLNRNVSGRGDRFSARWLGASGTQMAQGSYFLPLNKYGTELGFIFGFNRVALNLDDVDDADHPVITGTAYNYGVLLSQPLDSNRVWSTDLGMNFRRVTSYFDATPGPKLSTNVDDIRSLQVGLNYNKPDRFGRTFARVQNTFGLDWMGARHWQGVGQPVGRNQFWKVETMLNRVIVLPKRNIVFLRSYSQFTPDALPPAEQFQVGGANSVRGYTEGLLAGDRGYNIGAEWRWPVPFLSKVSPWLSERVQGVIFADFGQAYYDRSNPTFIRANGIRRLRTTLFSAGFGVRAQLTQYLQGFLDAGFGLLDRKQIEPNAQPTARIHFGIRNDLLPEVYKGWGRDTMRVERQPGRRVKLIRVEEPVAASVKPVSPAAIKEDRTVETVEFAP